MGRLFRSSFQHLYDVERRRIPNPPDVTLRLNRLERAEPVGNEVLEAIWGSMPPEMLQRYPDYVPFYEKLSNFVGVPKERIVVGAGIEDFIRTLYLLCCDPGERVMILWPTCAMFEVYAKVFNINLDCIVTDPYGPPTIDMLINALSDETRLALIANPGQPVETLYSVDEMRELAKACRDNDTVLAVDEAYHGFGAPTALPLVDEFDNVLILRTFSKAYGAASIRVGFAVGQEKVIKPLDAIRESGEVTGPSMWAAGVLMDDYDWFVLPYVASTCIGREWLRNHVAGELNLPVWGSHANHVLIDVGAVRRDEVVAKLFKAGVAVRGGFEAPLAGCILVTCGPVKTMQLFFDVFAHVMRGAQ